MYTALYRYILVFSSRPNLSFNTILETVKTENVDIHRKFYGDRSRGTPPWGELNPRGVAKYADFEPNRKSRLVPKSVTLNGLELRNGRYFALFQRIR